jgi:phosphonopyruvate decarboxylase
VSLSCKRIYDAFANNGVSFYAGVPDSLVKAFCAYVTDNTDSSAHIITANEGSAVALAVGRHLATGEIGLVYLQNSGLGNAINPLTSLADPAVYGVPLLLMIGWRGEPGKKDEPQHVKMGRVTLPTLNAIGVPNVVLPETESEAVAAIEHAVRSARSTSAPFALVVRKGSFEPYELQGERPDAYAMSREEAIASVLESLPANSAVVTTTGMPSREVFELREKRGETHDSDFLTVGSMGHSSQIALGVALASPERPVYCLDGDGAVLMHMGGLATIGSLGAKNFKHVVVNNAAHDSVGGQPTVGHDIDLCAIAMACGYTAALRADGAAELTGRLAELASIDGPALLELRIRKGARKDLGRPTNTPEHTKQRFMDFLRK